jgi:hypothetical protein
MFEPLGLPGAHRDVGVEVEALAAWRGPPVVSGGLRLRFAVATQTS